MITLRLNALRLLFIASVLVSVLGCSTHQANQAQNAVDDLQLFAQKNDATISLQGGVPLKVVLSNTVAVPVAQLNVYIGGDGMPWVRGGTEMAANPTNYDKTLLGFMENSPLPSVFLARPCYYIYPLPEFCDSAMWTSARYSKQVIDEMEAVLRRITLQYSVRSINIIGFSGGATLAVLLASRADDSLPIDRVVSIAGNLTVKRWVSHHHYIALESSLDAQVFLPLSQPHLILIAEKDENIPPSLYLSQPELMGVNTRVKVFENYTHSCCWLEQIDTVNNFLTQ